MKTKKYLLVLLLGLVSIGMSAQFKYKEGAKIYVDAGLQYTRFNGFKIGVSLEGGIRLFEILLLKAGCSYYLPYTIEVFETFRDDTFNTVETTIDKDIYLGYFHVGIGVVL